MAGRELHILLVDDNADHVKIMLWALEQSDVHSKVTVAHDGKEALRLLSNAEKNEEGLRRKPDLIFLDINLPDINGFEVLRKLRNENSSADIPVIILSSSDRTEDIAAAYENGANTFISKALIFNEIAQAINTVCVYWAKIAFLPTRSD